MLSIPAFLSSKAFGYSAVIALVVGYTSAVFYAGTQSAGKAVAKAEAKQYRQLIAETRLTLESAYVKEIEGREHENQIRNIRVTLNPTSCKPTHDERVRFIERQRARDALSGGTGTVPGGMSPSEADERD